MGLIQCLKTLKQFGGTVHYLIKEDVNGDAVEGWEVCSDSCHRWLAGFLDLPYNGWYGCHEAEFDTSCHSCGDEIAGVCGPYVD